MTNGGREAIEQELKPIFDQMVGVGNKMARDNAKSVKLTDLQLEFLAVVAKMKGLTASQAASIAISRFIMDEMPFISAPNERKQDFFNEYADSKHL